MEKGFFKKAQNFQKLQEKLIFSSMSLFKKGKIAQSLGWKILHNIEDFLNWHLQKGFIPSHSFI